jgi:hypothetical protein
MSCHDGIASKIEFALELELMFGWEGRQILVRQPLIMFLGAPSFCFFALLVGYEAAR